MLLWWLFMGAIRHNAHVSSSLAKSWPVGATTASGTGFKSDVCRHGEHGDDCRLLARVRGGNDADNPPAGLGPSDPTLLAAARFIDGYSDQVYAKMRDDVARTEAFRKEILRVAPGKVVLDIGTGALALLAIFAAEAGASKVYAIEANAHSYAKALQSVRESGFSDRIVVLEGLSTNVTLPERVDLLVHENLGEIVSFEGAPLVIRDAQRRHLKTFPSPSFSALRTLKRLVLNLSV